MLVFFAGHGLTKQGSRGPVGYLVPVDGDPDDLSSLIGWNELTRSSELIPAKHILFIIDACYSGLALQRAITPGTKRFINDMLQRFSRQVITAGKADETVADDGSPQGANSIFTGYLIEGIRGKAVDKNGVLTANSLMHYVYQQVSQQGHSQQTPHYGHLEGDGDFILRTPDGEHLKMEGKKDFLVQVAAEMPDIISYSPNVQIVPSFAKKNGYTDPEYPSFGRNDWSARLGESKFYRGIYNRDVTKAFSWLSLIAEPITNEKSFIDIGAEIDRLPNLRMAERDRFEKFFLPRKSMTTIDSLIFFGEYYANRDLWGNYLRVDKNGNIEYADSNSTFADYDGVRHFAYVRTIGLIWQFMFLTKDILTNVGYRGGVRLLVNLVGTRDTILSDFSQAPGENQTKWITPFDQGRLSGEGLGLKCPTPNLQLEYKLIIDDMGEENSFEIIHDISRQLGLAYNHKSPPRCFNYNTRDFPWTQYLNDIAHSREALT